MFKVNLEDLGIEYRGLWGQETESFDRMLWEGLETQHDKPTAEGWEAGYADLLKENRTQPKYLTDNNKEVYRYNGKFIGSHDTQIEKKYLNKLLEEIWKEEIFPYTRYKTISKIIEFGAGTGHNLSFLKNIEQEYYDNIELDYIGYDFSLSAVEIMKKQGLKSFYFNMYDPNYFWDLRDSVVFTIGAMEQLGDNFQPFADYLLASKTNLVVHIEPIIEFYDPQNSFDQLAIEYHKKRHYLGEYYTYLKEKKVCILHAERTYFGNIYNEGYSVIIWQK